LFVEAYIANGGNATRAAETAGFKRGSGAEKAGYRMSKDVRVREIIALRRAEALAQAKLDTDNVIASIARDIRFDPAKLYKEDGRLKSIHEIDEDTRLALRGVEIDEIAIGRGEERTVVGHTTKVKFPEKTGAREQAMKHLGLYEKDNRQKPAPLHRITVEFVSPKKP